MNKDDFFNEGESWKPFHQCHRRLVSKAKEINDLICRLGDSFPDIKEDGFHPVTLMQDNMIMIQAKLAGAQVLHNIYHKLMENAVLIRVNMEEIKVQLFAAIHMHDGDENYVQVVKDEITAFRLLFIAWVQTFDRSKDFPDEWHLFNDPDSFPKDDEPFNRDDFDQDEL